MFNFVIQNHNVEDSENWSEPIAHDSDAFLAVKEFSIFLKIEKQ